MKRCLRVAFLFLQNKNICYIQGNYFEVRFIYCYFEQNNNYEKI